MKKKSTRIEVYQINDPKAIEFFYHHWTARRTIRHPVEHSLLIIYIVGFFLLIFFYDASCVVGVLMCF